jgi:hypothetical protein
MSLRHAHAHCSIRRRGQDARKSSKLEQVRAHHLHRSSLVANPLSPQMLVSSFSPQDRILGSPTFASGFVISIRGPRSLFAHLLSPPLRQCLSVNTVGITYTGG